MAFLGTMLTALLGKFASLAGVMIAIAVAMFAAFWLLGTDLGVWLFEQALDLAITVLNSFDIDFELFNLAQYIPGLPDDLANMMGLIGFGQSMSIILGAVTLKVLLQLVPFTRLGS